MSSLETGFSALQSRFPLAHPMPASLHAGLLDVLQRSKLPRGDVSILDYRLEILEVSSHFRAASML